MQRDQKNKFKKYALGGGEDPKPKTVVKTKPNWNPIIESATTNMSDKEAIKYNLLKQHPLYKRFQKNDLTEKELVDLNKELDTNSTQFMDYDKADEETIDWYKQTLNKPMYKQRLIQGEGYTEKQADKLIKQRLKNISTPSIYVKNQMPKESHTNRSFGFNAAAHWDSDSNRPIFSVDRAYNNPARMLYTTGHERGHQLTQGQKGVSSTAKNINYTYKKPEYVEDKYLGNNPSGETEIPARFNSSNMFLEKSGIKQYEEPFTENHFNIILEKIKKDPKSVPVDLYDLFKVMTKEGIIKHFNEVAKINNTNTESNKYTTMARLGVKLKPKFQQGGRIYDLSGTKSKIADGVLHRERNNIPQEIGLGKKGIPVVVKEKQGGQIEKHAEVEVDELIIPRKKADILEDLVYRYLQSNNQQVALQIGKFIQQEILYNTIDSEQNIIKNA